jgi:hypothetical protein
MRPTSFLLETLSHYVRGDEGPPPGVPVHVDAGFETRLATMSVEQRVTPFLSRSLSSLALPPSVSSVTVTRLSRHAEALVSDTERRMRTMNRAVTRLVRAEVKVALCGEARMAEFHAGDALRPVNTIELLIDEHDTARAMRVLEEEGYGLSHAHPVFGETRYGGRVSERRASELVAYHHYFAPLVLRNVQGDTIGLRLRLSATDHPREAETAWSRVTSMRMGGEEIPAVALEDHLVDLCVRAGATALAELLWIVDIGRLVSLRADALDWDRVEVRAREQRVYGSVRYTLRHVCNLMRIPDAARRLRPAGIATEPLMDVWWRPDEIDYGDLPARRAGGFLYGLLWSGGLVSKLRWAWRHLNPEPRWVRNRLNERPTLWRRLKFALVVRDVPAWTPPRLRESETADNVVSIDPRGSDEP